MNTRSLLSLILLCATTFDATLFAAKRSFDEVNASELSVDDDFCDDDKQEDDKDTKSKPSSISTKRPYKCKRCTLTFTTHDSCADHERTHTEERPYRCKHCLKTFTQINHYEAHELIHTGARPYKCKHCPKTFKQSGSRGRHQKTCAQNPSLSLSKPQQLTPHQEAANSSLPEPTLIFYTNALVFLMQAGPTQKAQPLPLLNPDADDAE